MCMAVIDTVIWCTFSKGPYVCICLERVVGGSSACRLSRSLLFWGLNVQSINQSVNQFSVFDSAILVTDDCKSAITLNTSDHQLCLIMP